jgi:hypothetical protein
MSGCIGFAALVGFAALMAVVWLLMWWLDPDLRRGRKYEAELAIREPLSDEAMIRQYFAADDIDPEVPAQVRRVFAKHTEYPAEKLLPDDDLAFFWADLDMAELIEELESGFGFTITSAETKRTPCTIRAASHLVASKAGRTKRRT